MGTEGKHLAAAIWAESHDETAACLLGPRLSAIQVYREHEPPPHLPCCKQTSTPATSSDHPTSSLRELGSSKPRRWCEATPPARAPLGLSSHQHRGGNLGEGRGGRPEKREGHTLLTTAKKERNGIGLVFKGLS